MANLDLIQAPRGMDAYTNEIEEGGGTFFDRPLLSRSERRKTIQEIGRKKKLLDEAGYFADLAEFAYVSRQIMLKKRSGKAVDPFDEMKRSELQAKIKPFQSEYRTLEYLNDRIEADTRERKRLQLIRTLKQGMGNEAITVADNLSDALSRLGFKDEQYSARTGKTRIKRVTFSHADIRPDSIYYKIDNLRKMWFFGYRNILPNGVKLSALLDDKVMLDLTLAVQRPVEYITTRNNGAWLRYYRIRKEDEIPQLVSYRDVMSMYPTDKRSKLMIPSGVREGRRLVWVSMADNPHCLIAGTTGGGKSNMGHVMLCTLINQHTPDEVRLIMVDLKGGLDLQQYGSIPHLVGGKIIRDVPHVYPVLKKVEEEMERRFRLLLDNHCKNIDVYNTRYDGKLAHVFVFIDEFQQVLTGENKNKTMELMSKLLAQGRAPGIHLVITTQTPKTDILPTMFQSNIGLKFVGRMETQAASMTALQNAEATKLPKIAGRMIMQIGEPITLQTPFISDDEQLEIITRVSKPTELSAPTAKAIPSQIKQIIIESQEDETSPDRWAGLTSRQRDVLKLIALGQNRTTDIAFGTGMIKTNVSKVLNSLKEHGLVTQSAPREPYTLTEEAKSILPASLLTAEELYD